MMKASAKRRRSRAQVLEDKLKAEKKDEEMQQQLAQMAQMQEAIRQMQAENQLLQQKTQDIQTMFDDGVIKPDGQGGYQPVLDPAEKEHIRRQNTASKQRAMMEASTTQ